MREVTIKNLLEEHLLPEELLSFQKLNIFDGFEELTKIANAKDEHETPVDLTNKISLFVHLINSRIVSVITESDFKTAIKSIIAKVARILIVEIKKELTQYSFEQLAYEINDAIKQAEYIHGYDGQELRELLQIDKITAIQAIQELEVSTPSIFLNWQIEKRILDKLAHTLKNNYDYIKSTGEFINFFDPSVKAKSKIPIRWNSDKIYHLAYLLNCLYKPDKNPLGKQCFKVSEGKGYFKVAEVWFCDYSKNPLEKDIRKISSKINNKSTEYSSVIADINAVMREIFNKR